MPAGQELVPDHDQDGEADEEIDQGDHDGGGGDDEPGEIDLADGVGVADQAVGGFGQGSGEELPGQQAGEDQEGVGGGAGAGHLGEGAEDEGEDDQGQEGPAAGPRPGR